MKWTDKLKIGIPAVDAQHKRLVELVGELNASLKAGLKASDIRSTFNALEQYKTRHFQLEEKHMVESDYPGLAKQQQAHAYFTERVAELGAELDRTGLTPKLVNSLRDELGTWLKEHVTGLDMEFGKFYRSRH